MATRGSAALYEWGKHGHSPDTRQCFTRCYPPSEHFWTRSSGLLHTNVAMGLVCGWGGGGEGVDKDLFCLYISGNINSHNIQVLVGIVTNIKGYIG